MSIEAARLVADRKYKNVKVFRDGLPGWKKAGYTTNITKKMNNIQVPVIEPEKLNASLHDFLVIDIRPANTYHKIGYIPDSKAIPLAYLSMFSQELSKKSKIVIVDLQGKRSNIAAKWLISHGYEDVSMLNNGLVSYRISGFSLEK